MAKKKTTTKKSKKISKARASKSKSPVLNEKWLIISLLVVTGLAFSPILTNDFISLDDDNFILSNPVVQKHQVNNALTKQLFTPHYKPLVYLSWIAENALFGNSSFVFHLNNWLLHLLNTFLVFLCFRKIASFWEHTKPHALWIAFFGALIFGVHPLHVESVAWAIERKDVMFTCFFLAGTFNYLRFMDGRVRKFLLYAGLFYILTLLSKSMGVTLIGVVFLLDWAAGRRDWKQMVIDKWPFVFGVLLALIVYGLIYHPKAKTFVGGLGEGAPAPPADLAQAPGAYQQIVIANFRYLFFLLHSVFPVRLSLVYPREFLLSFPGGMIHGLFLLTAAIWALPLLLKKYRTLLLTGLLFFTMTIAPILVEEGPGTNFGSDRYTYVPSLGLILIVVALLIPLLQKKLVRQYTWGHGLLALIAAILSVGSFAQATKWNNSLTLYDQAVNNYPDNWVALHYRGGELEEVDVDAALADYTASINLNPSRYKTWFSRGTLYLKYRRNEEAMADFTRTIELSPRYWKAWVNRANCLRDMGRNREAIADYDHVLNNDKRFVKAWNNRGVAHLNLGRINKALADFNKVLELNPRYAKAYINRAAVYFNNKVQQYDNAIADYDRCLQIEPENWQAHYFRGLSLQKLGRLQEALASVDNAIRYRPNTGMYYYSRAQLLRNLNRLPESVQAAQTAKSLGYDVPARFLTQ